MPFPSPSLSLSRYLLCILWYTNNVTDCLSLSQRIEPQALNVDAKNVARQPWCDDTLCGIFG